MISLLLLFFLVLLFLALASVYAKPPPFLLLLAGAVIFGLAAGMDGETLFRAMISGIGRIFGLFAIIIFSGAVIAKTLQAQGLLERMVADIRAVFPGSSGLSGVAGYVFSLPTTCCITAFMMLAPVIGQMGRDPDERKRLLFLTAGGSVLSYTLVYPTPVVIPLFLQLGTGLSPLLYDLVAVPFSLLLLAGLVYLSRYRSRGERERATPDEQGKRGDWKISLRAWAPFSAILLSIPLFLLLSFSHETMIQAIMLAGLAAALIPAPPEARSLGLEKGTKHAGVILLDICGAGALGSVILESGFAGAVFPAVSGILPGILIPFAFAAIVQAALGSRVASAVIAAGVIGGTSLAGALAPLPLILSVAAGICIISWLTDPYFWLLHRATGATVREVTLSYTLPLLACGTALLLLALGLEALSFPS